MFQFQQRKLALKSLTYTCFHIFDLHLIAFHANKMCGNYNILIPYLTIFHFFRLLKNITVLVKVSPSVL